jgi:hypothetical protein
MISYCPNSSGFAMDMFAAALYSLSAIGFLNFTQRHCGCSERGFLKDVDASTATFKLSSYSLFALRRLF